MAPLSMKPGRRRNLTMTWLAASLLLALLSFASLSTSQQTASSLSFRLTLPCPQYFTSAVNRAVVGFSDALCNPMTSAVPLASCVQVPSPLIFWLQVLQAPIRSAILHFVAVSSVFFANPDGWRRSSGDKFPPA
ncbi:hypothetical protein L207DRAFT_609507 [Hyaloscypha variabilis F]|uniref:Uncharacterized protein n=1 Tax=Hyaloscypha variabilis (strain UAMH 11265 / GT02V1 / F) TaxID=1149755 RepID=A0A2J6R170_HYAVF|nr:hypothetical protein L207DRAFT_609507 [Hyaloscypha variabilis F]